MVEGFAVDLLVGPPPRGAGGLLSLRRVTPLAMATLQLLQTPIGSALGYALGALAEPSPTALVAGVFVLAGAGLVVAGGARRAAK
jgi:hypothetical protein